MCVNLHLHCFNLKILANASTNTMAYMFHDRQHVIINQYDGEIGFGEAILEVLRAI